MSRNAQNLIPSVAHAWLQDALWISTEGWLYRLATAADAASPARAEMLLLDRDATRHYLSKVGAEGLPSRMPKSDQFYLTLIEAIDDAWWPMLTPGGAAAKAEPSVMMQLRGLA